jgi:hypothetical protein
MRTGIPPAATYCMAVVFGGLGIYMLLRRHGPNLVIGVRLPWTLADRHIWDKSWRLGAMFLVGMGIGALISWTFFFIAAAHLIILGILYPVLLYRLKYGTLRFWKDQGWADYRPVVRCEHCGHWQKLGDAADLDGCTCEACGAICRRPRKFWPPWAG